MLLTEELWMQWGKNSAQDGLQSPVTQVLPWVGLYTPNGGCTPKGRVHLSATCHQRLPPHTQGLGDCWCQGDEDRSVGSVQEKLF